MRVNLVVLPIILPLLFWAGYHYYKDRRQPEPLKNLLLCVVMGAAAAHLGKLMYYGIGFLGWRHDAYELAATNLLQLFGYAVFIIGGIEETAKLLPFLLVAIRFKAFDEPIDGIIYASFIALGYAAVENYHYLEFLTAREAVYRGFAGPVVHIVFASIWGYYIGVARLAGRKLAVTTFAAVTVAALLHGVYDFLVIAFPATALPLAAALILAIWVWRLLLMRRIHQ